MYLHLVIYDRSVSSDDPRHADYISVPNCWNIARFVVKKAQENHSEASNICMYAFEKKGDWEKAKRRHYDQEVDWSLLDKPIKRVSQSPSTTQTQTQQAMSKKAYLVTFEITCRVVVDVTGDKEKDEQAICNKACNTVDFSDVSENISKIEPDTECPYDPETDE